MRMQGGGSLRLHTSSPSSLLSPHSHTRSLPSLQEDTVGKDPSVFFSVDFFMHETQATQVVASNAPAFNTIIQV